MDKEFFEKVEYLRANSDVGYEEAASLLERYDGDLNRAMIELEREHRLHSSKRKGENTWDNVFTRGKEKARAHYDNYQHTDNWLKKLLRAQVAITRDGETVAEVPVVVPIVTTIFAPYITIAGAVVGGLAGYRVKDARKSGES